MNNERRKTLSWSEALANANKTYPRNEFLGFLPMPLAFLGVVLLMALALSCTWFAMHMYEQAFQRPLCLEYAARKQLPNLAALEYESVSIADGRSRRHSCLFRNRQNGFPVELVFDTQDIPTLIDNMNVMAGVAVFVLFGFLSVPLTPRRKRSHSMP